MTLAGSSCWGLSGSVGQYLFSVEDMDSKWLVPIRLCAAGAILLVYCFIRFGKSKTMEPWNNRKKAVTMLVYGIIGVACCQFLYSLTIQLSNAAIGTILQDLAPVFVLLYLCIRDNRRPYLLEIASVVMAFLGVFLLTTHGAPGGLAIPLISLITGILSAVCVMIYNVVSPGLTQTIPVTVVQGWAFVLGGVLFFLVFHVWDFHYIPTFRGLLGILSIIFIGNIAAYSLYIKGVLYIGPKRAVLYSFAEPVTAAVISALFMGTRYTVHDYVGFLCIFVMLWMTTFGESSFLGRNCNSHK